MRRDVVFYYFLLALIMLIPKLSFAYQCVVKDSKTELSAAKNSMLIEIVNAGTTEVRAKVLENFKGKADKLIKINLPPRDGIEGTVPVFENGKQYLLATNKYDNKTSSVALEICEYYLEASSSQDLVKWLRLKEFKDSPKSK